MDFFFPFQDMLQVKSFTENWLQSQKELEIQSESTDG